jgi:hypothetical protein
MAQEYKQYKQASKNAEAANTQYLTEAKERLPKKIPPEERPGKEPVGGGQRFYPRALAPLAGSAKEAAKEYVHIV